LIITILIFEGLVLTFNIYTQNSLTDQFTQNGINLTCTWKANDGGTYYIRNIGNDVWWLELAVTMMERHFPMF